MKFKHLALIAIAAFAMTSLTACGSPKLEKLVEIAPNQTAFMVPLEGNTKADQGKFMSEDYLNQNKVATKRVSLPQRKVATGRFSSWDYVWVPTAKIIAVDRTPVTREWTGDDSTGTAKTNQALWVESSDSIGFGLGVNVTAHITEEDAAKFLYNYAGKPLQDVVDQNVRGYINSVLSREFSKYTLEQGRDKKNAIIDIAQKATTEHFAQYGVTIDNLGFSEGMVYEDKEIQDIINKNFTAEMKIQIEQNNNMAQDKVNERNVSIAVAARRSAEEFAKAKEAQVAQVTLEIQKMNAQANLERAGKWNGSLPAQLMPADAQILYGITK